MLYTAVGVVVFAIGMAPWSTKIWIFGDDTEEGSSFALDTRQSVDLTSMRSNSSFSENGSPCNGPTTLPVLAKIASNCFALDNASSKRISERQFTSCWAMAALWQNALTTQYADHWPLWMLWRIVAVEACVISTSFSDRYFPGIDTTFVGTCSDSSMIHSLGMSEYLLARASLQRSSQLIIGTAVPSCFEAYGSSCLF